MGKDLVIYITIFLVHKFFQWHDHSAALVSTPVCSGAGSVAGNEIKETVYNPLPLSSSFDRPWHPRNKKMPVPRLSINLIDFLPL